MLKTSKKLCQLWTDILEKDTDENNYVDLDKILFRYHRDRWKDDNYKQCYLSTPILYLPALYR